MSATIPSPSPLARHWALDPEIIYLNHGSFGACPREVLAAQQRYRDRMEGEAIRFFVQELDGLMDASRARLAAFLNADVEDLVFIPNATTAVATVLANIQLRPGDEIIANTHEYPACMNNLRRAAARSGAQIVNAAIPFPIRSSREAFDAIMSRVTTKTRLVLLSHVTSPSGLILPVQELVEALSAKGIDTLVDGAHAPGFCEVDLKKLSPAYYTANCHKWICSPKGSAFLFIRRDRQQNFRPLVLSNFAEKPKPGRPFLHTEFDYIGTDDYSACLAIGDAVEFMPTLVEGGWPAIRKHNRELVLKGRDILCRGLAIEPPAPDSMIGCLTTLILPQHTPELREKLAKRPSKHHDALQDAIIDRHRIQVPIWSVAGGPRTIRLSAQLYNTVGQYEYLAGALREELAREQKLG
ncbi:MAG: aminotransferase class V-fold PLP-dependent enzyme [Phycisphaerales bacterium]|nr:aminotransferase class V-fold PLP-dependent enzyme [Phycisphaerales bacterium]